MKNRSKMKEGEERQVKEQEADKSSEFLEMWSSRLRMS